MLFLQNEELEDLAWGAAILGSGGGGDTAYDFMIAKEAIAAVKKVPLLTLEELNGDELIVSMEFIGAPLVYLEKFPSGREFETILSLIEKRFGRKPSAVFPAEIGGGNAFPPIYVAAKWGIPLLDADMLGRAFPELQMCSCALKGISSSPAFIADALGNGCTLEIAEPLALERISRQITVAMGSIAGFSSYPMSGHEAKKALIPGSVSRAVQIGKLMRITSDPISALLEQEKGERLITGTITEIDQIVEGGFLKGFVTVSDDQRTVRIDYQNEYLIAKEGETMLAATPDILTLLDADSGQPIASEALRYGLRVVLICLPSPAIWKTPEGFALVGPHVFGYTQGAQV
ncbi:MAG: DUF917 domain-containing protein [Candidatus Melainabacteria bacterium]|nr:DUF917 domain-containing protein [Candidatus Melainabacteria bacterium]